MVKRGFLVMMMALALAACDDDSPTAPEDPNVVTFTAQLSAANEVPPVSNAESTARGDVRIVFNLTRDAGNNVTGATATFTVNLNSFPAGSTWTLAHIHEGASGVAGGVRVNTGLTPGTAVALAAAASRITRSTTSRSPTRPSSTTSSATRRASTSTSTQR